MSVGPGRQQNTERFIVGISPLMTNATKLDLIKSVDVIGPRVRGVRGFKTVRGFATGMTSVDARFLTRAASWKH